MQFLTSAFPSLAVLLLTATWGLALPQPQPSGTANSASNFTCPTADIARTHCMGPKDCLYPNPGNCKTFIACSVNADDRTGTPHVKDCPAGLEWNDKQKWCDWPANIPSSS